MVKIGVFLLKSLAVLFATAMWSFMIEIGYKIILDDESVLISVTMLALVLCLGVFCTLLSLALWYSAKQLVEGDKEGK